MYNENTQRNFIIHQLETKGFVTRNFALKYYISRLGAIIYDLKQEGWEIDGLYNKDLIYPTSKTDYVYRLISKPKKQKENLWLN